MRPLRVYIDTSVIGGCCDPEFSIWSNGLMKDFELGRLYPVISDIVDEEISRAPASVQDIYHDLCEMNPERIELTLDVRTLAARYLSRKILTKKFLDDAVHIALATYAKVDVLVSWNFRHIVHYQKIRMYNAVNAMRGYPSLDIRSPAEVIDYEEDI